VTKASTPRTQPIDQRSIASLERLGFIGGRLLIYGTLLFWAFICLFPIYWTVTTSFKTAVNVTQGDIVPFIGRFMGDWRGWRSLGLSPDSIFEISTVRDEFLLRFENSLIVSTGGAIVAVIIGSNTNSDLGETRTFRFSFYLNCCYRRWFWRCRF